MVLAEEQKSLPLIHSGVLSTYAKTSCKRCSAPHIGIVMT